MNLFKTVNEAKDKAIREFVKGLNVKQFFEKIDDQLKENIVKGLTVRVRVKVNFIKDNTEIGKFVGDYEELKDFLNNGNEFLKKNVETLLYFDNPEVRYDNDNMPYMKFYTFNIVVY